MTKTYEPKTFSPVLVGEFTASWGEICQCVVKSLDRHGIAKVDYLTNGKMIRDAFLPFTSIDLGEPVI